MSFSVVVKEIFNLLPTISETLCSISVPCWLVLFTQQVPILRQMKERYSVSLVGFVDFSGDCGFWRKELQARVG